MWFITSVIKDLDHPERRRMGLDHRTFGFYQERQEACIAIEENRGNMEECLYNYLVLEEINEGIHPEVQTELWYHWSEEHRKWMPCTKPSEFIAIVNWALG